MKLRFTITRLWGLAATLLLGLSAAAQVATSGEEPIISVPEGGLGLDLISLIQSVGLPIGILAAVLFWLRSHLDKQFSAQERREGSLVVRVQTIEDRQHNELKDIVVNSNVAINNNTKVLEEVCTVIAKQGVNQ